MIKGARKLCPGHSRAGGDPRGGFGGRGSFASKIPLLGNSWQAKKCLLANMIPNNIA